MTRSHRAWSTRIIRLLKYPSAGHGFGDKLKLILLVLTRIPFRFLKGNRLIWFEKFSCVALQNVMLAVDGMKHLAIDFPGLAVLSYDYEPFMKLWFKVLPGENVVDVGAHIGKYTLQAAAAVGRGGIVVALEPHPSNYSILKRAIELNRLENVIALNCAAWKCDCRLPLSIASKSGHHTLKSSWGLGQVIVHARTLDSILRELRMNRLHWVKIDAEGAECEILEGMGQTLQANHPTIIIEVGQLHMRKVREIAESFDYCVIQISPTIDKGAYWLLCDGNTSRPAIAE